MMQSVRWRALVWGAVVIGAAAAVGLGVDVAVAGTDKAAGLAGVIVGFCEVGALVLGVAGWAGERRVAADRHEPGAAPVEDAVGDTGGAPTGNGGAAGKYVVDARQADGVQIGDGNIQHNEFRRSSTTDGEEMHG